MSLFYDCNECKEKEYVKENVIRASNQLEQQAIVDQQIAESLGLDVQASTLSKLAKRVINSIGSELLPTDIKVVETAKQKLPTDYLLQAITTGKLSQLFDRIKAVPKSKLSKKAQIIQDDLKNNQEVKDVLNDMIASIVEKNIPLEEKSQEIEKSIIDYAAGGDGKAMRELVDSASLATTASSTWKSVLSDIPALEKAQATIDSLIKQSDFKTIPLFSTDKYSDGTKFKKLDYGSNKYVELQIDNDGPQFLIKTTGKSSKIESIDYDQLKKSGVLPKLNTSELIRSLTNTSKDEPIVT